MTLIVAFQQPGINCIISDLRVTNSLTGEGRNSALKTGILCNGCIYGVVGAAHFARKFIRSFKEVVRSNRLDNVSDIWDVFLNYSKNYTYDKADSSFFYLILSERSSGKPKFHILDSKSGTVQTSPDSEYMMNIVPFGSGANITSNEIQQKIGPKLGAFHQYAFETLGNKYEDTACITPYLVCLWLNELSLGDVRYDLEQNGVGGAFHFICQTSKDEVRQETAWYVITSTYVKKNEIRSVAKLHKVTPLSSGVGFQTYLEDSLDTQESIFVDGASDYEHSEPTPEMIENLRNELKNSSDNAKFCGFGYSQDRFKNQFTFIIDCKSSDIVNHDGTPSEYLSEQIKQAIAKVVNS